VTTDPRETADAEPPVVHDKRRIDPQTGQVRDRAPAPDAGVGATPDPGAGAEPAGEASSDAEADALEASLTDLEAGLVADLETVQADLAERTADLQRLHAEYANYRKRVERDRESVRDQAVASAFGDVLAVLDDIGRAREHGELDGAFKAVGEALEAAVTKAGFEAFGAEGDPFDPTLHEAFMHETSAEVSAPTCVKVFRRGYRRGERIVRPAQVAVADPE
jgi:molecular chaperone GrpE